VNRELACKVADAVLYEGYMLYPYRPSAVKNQQRWSFGILYPPAYNEVAAGTERCLMHSECIVESTAGSAKDITLEIQLRFLHLVARRVAQSETERSGFRPMKSLEVDGRRIESWDEGIERSVELKVNPITEPRTPHHFHFAAGSQYELLRDNAGQLAGILSRTQHEVRGVIGVSAEPMGDSTWKLTVDVNNATPLRGDAGDRNAALFCSLLSAHTILAIHGGAFVSLLDPPSELSEAIHACQNIGNFPVLVGEAPERDMLLCSPIVLYDYPQIAPESANNFYDSTEMDEMLTLRIMTLSDEEKSEMSLADDHVRNLLERTEQSAREQLARTHGVIRSMRSTGNKP
jgi:hypothetical protein